MPITWFEGEDAHFIARGEGQRDLRQPVDHPNILDGNWRWRSGGDSARAAPPERRGGVGGDEEVGKGGTAGCSAVVQKGHPTTEKTGGVPGHAANKKIIKTVSYRCRVFP